VTEGLIVIMTGLKVEVIGLNIDWWL